MIGKELPGATGAITIRPPAGQFQAKHMSTFNLMASLLQVRRLRAKEMEPIHFLSLEQRHLSIRSGRLHFT